MSGLVALSGSRADWQYLRHFDPVELFVGGIHEGHTMENATYMAESLLQSRNPDLLLVCGDRWEIALACVVATKLGIPIAHLGAGETTLGSYDEQFRGARSIVPMLGDGDVRPQPCAMALRERFA